MYRTVDPEMSCRSHGGTRWTEGAGHELHRCLGLKLCPDSVHSCLLFHSVNSAHLLTSSAGGGHWLAFITDQAAFITGFVHTFSLVPRTRSLSEITAHGPALCSALANASRVFQRLSLACSPTRELLLLCVLTNAGNYETSSFLEIWWLSGFPYGFNSIFPGDSEAEHSSHVHWTLGFLM